MVTQRTGCRTACGAARGRQQVAWTTKKKRNDVKREGNSSRDVTSRGGSAPQHAQLREPRQVPQLGHVGQLVFSQVELTQLGQPRERRQSLDASPTKRVSAAAQRGTTRPHRLTDRLRTAGVRPCRRVSDSPPTTEKTHLAQTTARTELSRPQGPARPGVSLGFVVPQQSGRTLPHKFSACTASRLGAFVRRRMNSAVSRMLYCTEQV